MTAFHTIAVPHEDILAGRERVQREMDQAVQPGRLWG